MNFFLKLFGFLFGKVWKWMKVLWDQDYVLFSATFMATATSIVRVLETKDMTNEEKRNAAFEEIKSIVETKWGAVKTSSLIYRLIEEAIYYMRRK